MFQECFIMFRRNFKSLKFNLLKARKLWHHQFFPWGLHILLTWNVFEYINPYLALYAITWRAVETWSTSTDTQTYIYTQAKHTTRSRTTHTHTFKHTHTQTHTNTRLQSTHKPSTIISLPWSFVTSIWRWE